MTVSQWSV